MIRTRAILAPENLRFLAVPAIVIMAAVAGLRTSLPLLLLLLAVAGGIVMLRRLELLLFAIPLAALLVPLQISTGTDVALNITALLVPVASLLWLISMMVRGEVALVPSRLNRPLLLFLIAGLFSLLIGNVLWDPAVPRANNFILVQLAQWAIIAFSAAALFLTANLIRDEQGLRQLTFAFLIVGGTLAILYVIPGLAGAVQLHRIITVAFTRAPLWMLLAALAGGQLLFNEQLALPWRLFCLLVIVVALTYALVLQRETLSNWLGVLSALGMLAWLRWPRFRFPLVFLILLLLAGGVLQSSVYEFAGGEAEWNESGGSRLALIERVLSVTWHNNPITGLGPAAYRPYAGLEPLRYFRALWFQPQINSHNNYVDLFAHFGLVGLALFFWFVLELARLGLALRTRFSSGFSAGYVNAMIAAGTASLVLMLFLDWILPFVYNVGFPGFQASVLVWLFLGGLVSLETVTASELASSEYDT